VVALSGWVCARIADQNVPDKVEDWKTYMEVGSVKTNAVFVEFNWGDG